jgi:(S)-sulfolactate dehydrogenase
MAGTPRARIVISEFMDQPAVEQLDRRFTVTYDAGLVDQPDALARLLANADALIVRNRTQVRGALLAAGTRLKVVGRLGVGLDNIDVAACEARGVTVIPATGANADAVAEYVMLAIGLLLRPTFLGSATTAAGGWPRGPHGDGREIAGKRLGLIGFGDIGRRVAARARAWGMGVMAFDPALASAAPVWAETGVTPAALDQVVREVDAISLHVPLVDATRGLFDAARLAAMKPGAILINTARGGIVDEAALAASLKAGHLGGAALDVFRAEPLPAGSPLADTPNLILTPHVGGVTREANARVSTMIAERVAARLDQGA